MAIDGLDNLVNSFETTSKTYNEDIEKILEEINNYVEDKSVEKFLDDYMEREPMFNEDTSNMSIEDKKYIARKLAHGRHDVEIENNEMVPIKDKDGKVIGNKPANEEENYEKELKEVIENAKNKKNELMKSKFEMAKYAQKYQAEKIEDAEKKLDEIKKELDERIEKDKNISDELQSLEDGKSKIDKDIEEAQKLKEDLENQIEKKTKQMEQIKKNDPDGYEKNGYYSSISTEIDGLKLQLKGNDEKIESLNKDKSDKITNLKKEKEELKIDEYTNKFNTFSDKVKEQKDKYKENAVKLEESFKKLGLDFAGEDKIKDENVKKLENQEKDVKEKSQNDVVASPQQNAIQDKSLTVPSARQNALNKINEYCKNSDPNERLANLSNDYEGLSAAINDIGIKDYLQRKELKNALDENTKLLQDNMQDSSYYINMLEDVLGKKLSKTQQDMCKSMFNQDKDKKGRVNNILSGTGKFSNSDLEQMKNVINEVKNSDLSPEQQEKFENDFLKYVQMGSLNTQVSRNFVSKLWHNNLPTQGARAQRQLENSICSYSDSKNIEKQGKEYNFNFINELKAGKTPPAYQPLTNEQQQQPAPVKQANKTR